LKMEVLPAPLGPISPWIWPALIAKVTRSTARKPPKLSVSSCREREVIRADHSASDSPHGECSIGPSDAARLAR
jgi:hypothetical protein